MLIGGSRLNVDFKVLLLVEYLLASAFFADISSLNSLAFSSTILTMLLHMLVHTGTEHHHLLDHSSTLTRSTGLHIGTTLSIASLADSLSRHSHLGALSGIDVF